MSLKTNNNLPNLIIAGVTKGGSTSVFSYLADHPQVCAANKKEVCYFMNLRFNLPLTDIESYKQHFKHCGKSSYRMEASPGYIYGGSKLSKGIKETLNHVKIIIILREPVERIHSFFTSHKIQFIIDQHIDFHEYLQRCKNLPPEKYNNETNYPYFQLKNGCYSDYLPAWLDVFGKNLKILFFDDLVRDNLLFMRTISDWLKIDPSFYDNYNFVVENKTRGTKSRITHRFATMINMRFEKFLRKNMRFKRFCRNIYYFLNESSAKENAPIATNDRDFLEKYYTPYNKRLRTLLINEGYEDLPDWLKKRTLDMSENFQPTKNLKAQTI